MRKKWNKEKYLSIQIFCLIWTQENKPGEKTQKKRKDGEIREKPWK